MKLHEYNQMMAYLTRPAVHDPSSTDQETRTADREPYYTGGRVGFGSGTPIFVATEENFNKLERLLADTSKTKKDINKIYNVGGGTKNSLSIIELLELLEKKINKKIKYKKFNWRSGDQKIYISNNTKIKKEHNWSPNVGTSEGLDRVIKWVNKNENEIKKILKI